MTSMQADNDSGETVFHRKTYACFAGNTDLGLNVTAQAYVDMSRETRDSSSLREEESCVSR